MERWHMHGLRKKPLDFGVIQIMLRVHQGLGRVTVTVRGGTAVLHVTGCISWRLFNGDNLAAGSAASAEVYALYSVSF